MRLRLLIQSLLPMLLVVVPLASGFAQDNPFDESNPFGISPQENPFGPPAKTTPANKDPQSQTETVSFESERLKKLRSQLQSIEKEFAHLATSEAALRGSLERVVEDHKLDRLKGPGGELDEKIEDTIMSYRMRHEAFRDEIDQLKRVNSTLKDHIKKLEESEAENKLRADKAENNRNEMHQALFERLILSDDATLQQVAFEHLFACRAKYQPAEFPIDVHTAKLLKRVSQLTNSESESVKQHAAQYLFHFQQNAAIELGFQFGLLWRPLEHRKTDAITIRIYHQLDDPVDLIYDEVPLSEILVELEQKFGIGIRMAADVDKDLVVTCDSVGRTLFSSLKGVLEQEKLAFAVIDEEIVVMKETNPDLIVMATYNITGLSSLADLETDKVLKMLEKALDAKAGDITPLGGHMFTAKTSEANQREIQKFLGNLAPTVKWLSK